MPAFERVLRGDGIARGAHLHRFRHTCQPRQPLRSRRSWNDAQFDFRLAHLRRRYRHPIVAGHRRFQAPAERSAVNRCHDWFGTALHAIEHAQKTRALPAIAARCDLAEFFDIRAGDEGTTSADQHNGLHGVIFFELFETGDDSFRDSRAQRVHGWIVYREDSNFAIFTCLNQIAHPYDSIA